MDRLFCMQVFVRVVERGAFVHAAESLGVSRATVTAAVAQLEKRLGTRLLNRTTRRLSLTDEGRSYYRDCVDILDQVAAAEEGLSDTRQCPRGKLRVSVPQSFVDGVFYPALVRFLGLYPLLEVEIDASDRAVNLIEDGIDCAIRGLEIPADAHLVARPLSAANWVTCAAPAYLAVHGSPRTVEDLADHQCIRFVSQTSGRPLRWTFGGDSKVMHYPSRSRLRLTSFDACIDAAIAGAGIVQAPDALVVTAVQDGRLLPVLLDCVAPAPPLLIIYPGNRYLTAKVRVFCEHMSSAFPAEGWWHRIAEAVQHRAATSHELPTDVVADAVRAAQESASRARGAAA